MKSHLLLSSEPITEGRDLDVLCGKQIRNAVCSMRYDFAGDLIPDFSTLEICQKCVRKLLAVQTKETLYLYALTAGELARHGEVA